MAKTEMKKSNCIVDCVGPDCEGCREYKTDKKMENKPTPEEILRKAGYDEDAIFISYQTLVKYMQIYAELYHKEKLREELIHFAGYHNDLHFPNAEAKYMISIDEIKEYLKTLNTK